ncbi:Mitochondrial distribution and morphology protein 12 [Tulasnella sp. 427]|nr:Mitochondrial distribution and morphology protein 12 [Tulasnella sp. 427]
MATVDLDWNALDDTLANRLVEMLNKHLSTVNRPSFLGPTTVMGFDFGTGAPEVEVLDIQDIHPDFLLEDDDENAGANHGNDGEATKHGHMGYDPRGVPDWRQRIDQDPYGIDYDDYGAQSPRSWDDEGITFPSRPRPYTQGNLPQYDLESRHSDEASSIGVAPPTPSASISSQPDIQLHLHISYHSNLRLTLSTSLIINYPAVGFMSLPMKLSIVGLVFSGEFVVAYEGSRRRIHLCIIDELDPASATLLGGKVGELPTPPHPSEKRVPIGQRLLPSVIIESEIGQTDKHVLKNVSRVERFLQDVIRKVIEDELVYPNFQTIVLPERSSNSLTSEAPASSS